MQRIKQRFYQYNRDYKVRFSAEFVKSLTEYLSEQTRAATHGRDIAAKLREMQAAGLDLIVHENPRSELEVNFVTKNYALADNVKIIESCGYGLYRKIVEFTHDLKTSTGTVLISCRHDDWGDHFKKDPSVAEYYHDNSGGDVTRQNPDDVIAFYQEKGVKEYLLDNLRQQIEKKFQTLTPYEASFLQEEVEKDPAQVKALRERMKAQKAK